MTVLTNCRWYPFGLLLLLCVPSCSTNAVRDNPGEPAMTAEKANRQRAKAIEALEDFGGHYRDGTLDLVASQVTDAGLVHLKSLSDLKYLYLDNTRVTDAVIFHL